MQNAIPVSRRGVLFTVMIGTLMAALDSSIVNVSVPAIMRSFHSTIGEVEWVVSAYMMGFAVVMPLTHWLSQRLGYFWLYFTALAVFTLGSLLCGLATTLPMLVAARIVQAAGGGMLTPVAMAILSSVFPLKERGRVLGMWGLGVIIGPALGPTLGGILTEIFGWPSIFLVNLPIGAVGLWLAKQHLAQIPRPEGELPFDWPGFASLTGCLVTLLYAISLLEHSDGDRRVSLALFIASAACATVFVRSELRSPHPMIRLGVFRNPSFVACLLVSFARAAALFGGVFLLPFLLQDLLGYSETQTGLLMFPGAAAVAALMPFSGRWFDRHGARGISIAGLSVLAVSMAAFSFIDVGTSVWTILLVMTARGAGLGLLLTPVAAATVNSVQPKEVTLASSLGTLAQQIGGSVGVATLAVLHQLSRNAVAEQGRSPQSAEHVALQVGFLAASLLTAVALLPAWYVPTQASGKHGEEGPLLEAG